MPLERCSRFILWIDSIATVMVCPQDEIWIGQAVPTSGTHLAFQATLRRRHAKLIRDRGSYWLSAEAETQIRSDGPWQPVPEDGTPLQHGQHFLLSETVNLRFARPNPLTSTAVIHYASNHRTVPRSDFTILMAEACLLGNGQQNHIQIPGLEQATFFFKQNQLHFRSKGEFSLNQELQTAAVQVTDGARIETPFFGLTVEALSAVD